MTDDFEELTTDDLEELYRSASGKAYLVQEVDNVITVMPVIVNEEDTWLNDGDFWRDIPLDASIEDCR
jgi:hypothetical protein